MLLANETFHFGATVKINQDGNFDYFVHWKAKFDDVLAKHLNNAKEMHVTSVLIFRISSLRDCILAEVRSAQFYSVMADECTDVSTKEQMSVCVGFSVQHDQVTATLCGFTWHVCIRTG